MIQVKARGEDHPDTLSTAWRLGELLLVAGTAVTDITEATLLLRTTAAHQARVLGDQHPNALRTRVSLGEALVSSDRLEDTEEARSILVECEGAQQAVLDEDHPDVVKTASLRRMLHDLCACEDP